MSRFYKGFKLDDLEKSVHFCHSVTLRALSEGKIENDKNTDYRDKLVSFDKKIIE